MKSTLLLLLAVFVLFCAGVLAAEPVVPEVKIDEKKPPVIAQYLFDRKVTNWVEGTVTGIGDAQFTVNKTQSFFAIKYAKMLSEINEKTTNFSPVESARMASEIRARWRQELKDVQSEKVLEQEMTFLLPSQSGGLHVLDESRLYTRQQLADANVSSENVADSYGKLGNWGDVKVGDRLVVGFQSQSESKNALVAIRVTAIAIAFEPGTKVAR